MDARPSSGLFLRLAPAGFSRVAGASAIATLLSLLVAVTITLAVLFGLPLFFLRPSAPLAAGLAALFTCSIGVGFLVDFIGNLALVRSACSATGRPRRSPARPASSASGWARR